MEDTTQNNSTAIGGEGHIIIINQTKVICACDYKKLLILIAEVKDIPPKTYFQLVEDEKAMMNEVVAMIKQQVLPGSWLVFDDEVYADDLYNLLHNDYPVIIKCSRLAKLNTSEQNAIDKNLISIWDHILESVLISADDFKCSCPSNEE